MFIQASNDHFVPLIFPNNYCLFVTKLVEYLAWLAYKQFLVTNTNTTNTAVFSQAGVLFPGYPDWPCSPTATPGRQNVIRKYETTELLTQLSCQCLHITTCSFRRLRRCFQNICYCCCIRAYVAVCCIQHTVYRIQLIIYQLTPVLTIILRLKSQLSNIYKSPVIKINYLDPVHAHRSDAGWHWSVSAQLTEGLGLDWFSPALFS